MAREKGALRNLLGIKNKREIDLAEAEALKRATDRLVQSFDVHHRLLCEAGIGICTAEAQRAQRKSPKNSKLNKSSVNSVSLW